MTDETPACGDALDLLTDADIVRWGERRGMTVTFSPAGSWALHVDDHEPEVIYLPGDASAIRFTDYQQPDIDMPPLMRAVAVTRLRAIADHIESFRPERGV